MIQDRHHMHVGVGVHAGHRRLIVHYFSLTASDVTLMADAA